MLKKLLPGLSLWGLLVFVMTACVPVTRVASFTDPTPAPEAMQTQIASREAQVESVDIQILKSDPVQINAVASVRLPDACTTLGDGQLRYTSNTFLIRLWTVSPTDRGCAPVVSHAESTYALNAIDLQPGTYTVTVNSVSKVFILTAADLTPNATPASVAVRPTATSTLPPMATPLSTQIVVAPANCTDQATYLGDVTVPDNTVIAPGTAFVKTWRFQNTGSCAWNSHYLVSYLSGTTMTQQPGYWLVPPEQRVEPGQTVDISVGMTAPVENGNYSAYWGLTGQNGLLMPIQGGAKTKLPDLE